MSNIEYLESVVEGDLPGISHTEQINIRNAIEKKLQTGLDKDK